MRLLGKLGLGVRQPLLAATMRVLTPFLGAAMLVAALAFVPASSIAHAQGAAVRDIQKLLVASVIDVDSHAFTEFMALHQRLEPA